MSRPASLARATALAGLLALSARAAPPPLPVPEVMEDGSELVVVLLPAARWSSLRLVVRAGGSQDPDEKGGVARLLGRSILDGVVDEHGTHLEELVRREGGTIVLHSTPSSTTYALDAPSDKFAALAGTVVAHVTSPRLSLVDVQKEVPLLNTEAPEPRGPRQPWARLERLLFPLTDPNSPVDGSPRSRQHIEREDLVAFFGKNYLTNAVTAVFAGAVTAEQVRTLVDQNMRLPPAIPDDRATPPKLDPVSLPLTERQSGPAHFAAVGYRLDKGHRRACQTLARAADVKVALALGKAGKAPWMEVRCLSLRGQDFLVASSPARSPDPYAFPDAVDRAFKDAAKAQPRGTGWIRLQQGAQRSLELLAEDPPAMADALAQEAVARAAVGLTDVSAVFFKPAPGWTEVKDLAKRSFREDRMFQIYLSPAPPGEK
ncbi:MAG TPA: insulinase family protein [Myxococcaceae bacterium]